MRILFPDAQFPGEPDIEREVAGPEAQLDVWRENDAAAIADAAWRSCDGIVFAHEVPLAAETVDRLESCRIVVRAGVGYESIDVAACAARGIPVCNVPDYGTNEVADHALALLLALARGIVTYHERLAADLVGGWHWRPGPVMRRLSGQRLGLIGAGHIGAAVGRRARAFGMEVMFHDPYLPAGREPPAGFLRVDALPELLAAADVVSLHCPLSDETREIIGRRAVAAMREGAILLNTARGGLVDPDALYDGLREGGIAAAGLDVWPHEPPDASHPLLEAWRRGEEWLAGRLILTPHAAFYSPTGFDELRRKAVGTVVSYLRDGRLKNCVNGGLLKEGGAAAGASRREA